MAPRFGGADLVLVNAVPAGSWAHGIRPRSRNRASRAESPWSPATGPRCPARDGRGGCQGLADATGTAGRLLCGRLGKPRTTKMAAHRGARYQSRLAGCIGRRRGPAAAASPGAYRARCLRSRISRTADTLVHGRLQIRQRIQLRHISYPGALRRKKIAGTRDPDNRRPQTDRCCSYWSATLYQWPLRSFMSRYFRLVSQSMQTRTSPKVLISHTSRSSALPAMSSA